MTSQVLAERGFAVRVLAIALASAKVAAASMPALMSRCAMCRRTRLWRAPLPNRALCLVAAGFGVPSRQRNFELGRRKPMSAFGQDQPMHEVGISQGFP